MRRRGSCAWVSKLLQDGRVAWEPEPSNLIPSRIVSHDALLRGVLDLHGRVEEIWVPVDSIERVVGIHPPLQRDPWVVLHVLAYVRGMHERGDPMGRQLLPVSNSGHHQNLRGANGP